MTQKKRESLEKEQNTSIIFKEITNDSLEKESEATPSVIHDTQLATLGKSRSKLLLEEESGGTLVDINDDSQKSPVEIKKYGKGSKGADKENQRCGIKLTRATRSTLDVGKGNSNTLEQSGGTKNALRKNS